MNKKKWLIFVVIFTVLWLFLFLYIYKNINNEHISSKTTLEIEDSWKCKDLNIEKAELLSIEKSDLTYCDCIKDNNRKSACKQKWMDNILYNNAIEQLDTSLCKNIISPKINKKCIHSVNKELQKVENETLYLANKYLASHNMEKAIEQFNKLLEIHPKKVKYMLDLAEAYAEYGLKKQEKWDDQSSYVNEALKLVERAKKLEPNNPNVYRVKWYVYEIKPDILTAITFYDQAIKLDSRYVVAYLWRAHAYNMQWVMDKALADLQKAASLDIRHEYLTIYSQLCRMESTRDDLLKDAIKNCKIIINSPTTDVMFKSESYQILAWLYIKAEKYDNAESLLLEAKALTPKDPNLYIQFAELYIAKWQMKEAEQMALKCKELSSTKAACYEKLSYSVYQQERFDEAIKIALEWIKMVDSDVSLLKPYKNLIKKKMYYTLANIYYYKKDSENEEKYLKMWDNLFDN